MILKSYLSDLMSKSSIKTGILLIAVSSAYAIAGWYYWQASESRPWMLGFLAFCVFYIAQLGIEQLAKPYFFHEKFLTVYIPISITFTIDNLDHLETVDANRTEYFWTFIFFIGLFMVFEFLWSLGNRYWKASRESRINKP